MAPSSGPTTRSSAFRWSTSTTRRARRGRRRHRRGTVRRRHVASSRHSLRPDGDPPGLLPARRRFAAAHGPAGRRAAGPRGRRRRRRRDVLRRRRGARSARLEEASTRSASAGAMPVVLGGDHTIALPDATGCRAPSRLRQGVDDPLRRARRHRRHHVRLAVGARPADAPAHRVRRAARRPVPADRAARLLARAGDADLDGRPGHAVLRDDRDRRARPRRLPHRGVRDRDSTSATACSCRSTSTSATPAMRRAPARPSRAACRPASCSTRSAGSASSCRSLGVDVVEVSPPYDHAEITAYLGNRVVLEALSGHRRATQGDHPRSGRPAARGPQDRRARRLARLTSREEAGCCGEWACC